MSDHLIVLDRLVGVRATAINCATALGPVLEGDEVIVDATGNASAAQGFVDELVKQLLVDRPAALLIVNGAKPTTLRYFNDSAGRRGVLDQLLVHVA
jgi:hypothetical protein